jgi:hypothetical protein
MAKKEHPAEKEPKEGQRHVEQIHLLAKRLPWLVVAIVALSALIFILQAFLGLT